MEIANFFSSKASNQGKKKIKKLKSIPERFKHLYEFYKAFKFESMFEADFMEKDDYFQEMQRQSRLNHSKVSGNFYSSLIVV